MEIIWAPTPNFTSGRRGRIPLAIVDHFTGALMPGILNWLQNPAAHVSIHYLITKDGVIYQLVREEDTAWHAGIVNHPQWSLYDGTNPNYYTIGIEHEGLGGDGLSEPQYQASIWLHRQLVSRWNIPVNRDHVVGHHRLDSINRSNDPGPNFPWVRLFTDMTALQPTPADPTVQINVGNLAITGQFIGDGAYGPIKDVAEALGSNVCWDDNNFSVEVQPHLPSEFMGIKVKISNRILAGIELNGRIFVSVRDLAESLGHQIVWDDANNEVTIV